MHFYYPPQTDMENIHWPCDVLDVRGANKDKFRVKLYTPEGEVERTVPAYRVVPNQRVLLEENRNEAEVENQQRLGQRDIP